MGYYIRVLSQSDQPASYAKLAAKIAKEHPKAELRIESGSESQWDQLLLTHDDDSEIALVERIGVGDDTLNEEIEEFLEEISDCQPASSVDWLQKYLPTVRSIYSFQVLSGVNSRKGWDILGTLKSSLWGRAPGIIQADGEGFTNEDGYHILWQFSESVSGEWWMGIWENDGWIHFKMDLGNRQHREAFLQGCVPKGAQRA